MSADPVELLQRIAVLERQLLDLQKASSVGQLASSITHEFNNILTTIINYARLGLRHKDAATRERSLDKILAAGLRASKITTGLLAYSRRGSDRREPVDLVQLVEQILVLVEKDLQVHRIRLQTEWTAHPTAVVNANQLQQVLLNLIINARQAMSTGGTLTVSVREQLETGFAEISVRDTGCGIPADNLRRIFDAQFTTKTADANGQGGSGLGLAMAREVIESHQGRIRVESTVGKGTCFTLKLPAVASEAAIKAATAQAAVQRSLVEPKAESIAG
jgi:signal transduction histidine kinase